MPHRFLFLSTTLAFLMSGCAEDRCKKQDPAFEVTLRLPGGALSGIKTLEIDIKGAKAANKIFPVSDQLDDGVTSFDVVVGTSGNSGFNVQVAAVARDGSGRPLATGSGSFTGSGDACNFFELTMSAAADGGVDLAADSQAEAGRDGGQDGGADLPAADLPAGDLPATDLPPTDAPLDAPAPDLPATDLGAPDAAPDLPFVPDASPDAGPVVSCTSLGTVCADGWCWENPLPQGISILSLWGTGKEVFAVGDHGTILHHDGTTWTRMKSNTTDLLRGVWGSSGTDVYAGGGTSTSSTLLHYNGKSWTPMNSYIISKQIKGLWVAPTGELFTGFAGGFYKYNGAWDKVSSGGVDFNVVWGITASSVYAAGKSLVMRYDGTSLKFHSNATVTPTGITNIQGIWGTSDTDLYIVGSSKNIRHYDGVAWTTAYIGTSGHLTLWGDGSAVVATGSGNVAHKTTSWNIKTVPGVNMPLNAVWGSGASSIFVAGDRGVTLTYSGSTWSENPTSLTRDTIVSVSGATSTDVYALTIKGDVLHYSGSKWAKLPAVPSANAIWAGAGGDLFAVGASGAIHRYSGGWFKMSPGALPTEDLLAVWGSSVNDIHAVGSGGCAYHFDGAKWTAKTSGTTNTLRSVWAASKNLAFAVGDQGTLTTWDGAKWTPSSLGASTTTFRAVRGSSATDVFAGGSDSSGTVLEHFNGFSWAAYPKPPGNPPIHGMARIDAKNLYVTDGAGAVYRYKSGAGWLKMDLGLGTGTFNALWGVPGALFLGGSQGTIMSRCGT